MKPGAFQADACVVVQYRMSAPLARDGLTLALALGSPPPEGYPFSEVKAEGYARQPFVVMPGGHHTLLNADPIHFFNVLDWPQAAHVCIINADGNVIAYGQMKTSPGPVSGYEVAFAVGAVRLQLD